MKLLQPGKYNLMFGDEGLNAAQMLGINVGGVVGAHGGAHGVESEQDDTGEIIGEHVGNRRSGAHSLRGNSKKGRKRTGQHVAAGVPNYKGKVFNNFMADK